MLVFTISTPSDTTGSVVVTPGVIPTQVATGKNNRSCYGFSLGYFNPRPTDIAGLPLRPKYFRIEGATEETTLNHMMLNAVSEDVPNKVRYGIVLPSDGADTDTESCLVFMPFYSPESRARLCDSHVLRSEGLLIEGRMTKNNIVETYDPKKKKTNVSYPSVLILNTNEDCSFTFRDTEVTHKVTIRFNGTGVEIVSDEIIHRRPARDTERNNKPRKTYGQRVGTLGEILMHADGYDDRYQQRHDRYNRRQKDKRHRKDAYDNWN